MDRLLPARALLAPLLALTLLGGSVFAQAEAPSVATENGATPEDAEQDAAERTVTPLTLPRELRESMLRADYEAVLKGLEGLAASRSGRSDDLDYMRAVALQHAGRGAEAASTLASLVEEYPDSPWRHKARFKRAELLRELGRHQEAEAIFEEEARRLRSSARQGELAAIYSGIADDLSSPRAAGDPSERQPDLERACTLYGQVLELDAPPAARAHAHIRIATSRTAQGNFHLALLADEAFLAEFDPSEWTPAVRKERGFLYGAPVATRQGIFESRLRRGHSQRMLGQARDARRNLEDAASDLDGILQGTERALEIWGAALTTMTSAERKTLETLAGDGRYALAATYSAQAEGELGIGALKRFFEKHPGHVRAGQAAFEIGERYQAFGPRRGCAHLVRNLRSTSTRRNRGRQSPRKRSGPAAHRPLSTWPDLRRPGALGACDQRLSRVRDEVS